LPHEGNSVASSFSGQPAVVLGTAIRESDSANFSGILPVSAKDVKKNNIYSMFFIEYAVHCLFADIYLDCNALFLHTRSTLGGSRTCELIAIKFPEREKA
jgi:hypothetical protein